MKRIAFVSAVIVALTISVVPAIGVDRTVNAGGGSNIFTPSSVTVAVGESVTWNNAGGTHNVAFDDGSFTDPVAPSSAGWTAQRTFSAEGTFSYHCQLHGGMVGTVVVGSGATTSTSTAPTVAVTTTEAATTQTTSPANGTTTASAPQTPTTTGVTSPALENVTLSTARLCRRKDGRRRCSLQGVRLSFKLSTAATLVGEIKRKPISGKGKYKRFGTLKISAKAGKQAITINRTAERKRLAKGRYQLSLRAVDSVGSTSAPMRLTIKVS